ncbi:hypothetical protein NP233_g4729 [Leucocoprinus birnbaumii]|uniref:Uncharacterized protein n=1 Tax=Leucocoprinus birnbaumii TaxID=56174 RepID=A0AAD5VWH5_9AGAR|nr:hypothetical protein NP233_g4729 [Leucocoprinus birnbaumii]
MEAVNPATTYGSILLGSFFAFGLSGAVSLQCVSYFKTYPHDGMPTKVLVSTVWLLDMAHSCFICASIWKYFITFFGQRGEIDYIPCECFYKIKSVLHMSGMFKRYKVALAAGRLFAATGLSLSSAVDLLIMGSLCYYLLAIRTRIGPNSTAMIRWVDLITLYTLENGALTLYDDYEASLWPHPDSSAQLYNNGFTDMLVDYAKEPGFLGASFCNWKA